MEFEQFKKHTKDYNIIPVYETVTADLLTPVLAYLKLREKGKYCFLLESVEGIGRLARYSFIGKNPSKVFFNSGEQLTINENGNTQTINQNLFLYLKEEISGFTTPKLDELPDFTGGIVGYLGYENITLIEDVLQFESKDNISTPDSIFALYNTIIAFDHYKHQLILISNVNLSKFKNPESAYSFAKLELRNLKSQLIQPVEYSTDFVAFEQKTNGKEEKEFYSVVEKSKKNIYDGDIFQIVLSKRFCAKYKGDLLNVYRALRIINPSPYMYFMEFDKELTIIGTSPEDLLKVKDRTATILPIAGTRKRGKTEREDIALEIELLNDPKEIAEHVMLVDLARNDLGRICSYGTVKVVEKMIIQRYSHVMHIVSRVEGILNEDKDCIDALMSAFPAGTLTGAPKIRAIQLIDNYETIRRNVYGGAVGYIDFSGNLDMCIAIRTLFAKVDTIYWQAGAGIVADSKPEFELKEILNKSAALRSALKYAEVIDENISN
jgi:anthranilate synthase component 1